MSVKFGTADRVSREHAERVESTKTKSLSVAQCIIQRGRGVTCDGLASHPGGVAILLVVWPYLYATWLARLHLMNMVYLTK